MIVVSCPQRGEASLLRGEMRCPRCAGVLRPHGHARARAVRGLGSATLHVGPRRACCADCRTTQVLLPGALTCRRADSTEVIGTALAANAVGAGFPRHRRAAGPAGVDGAAVAAPRPRAAWRSGLYERAVQRCATVDRELLVRPAAQPSVLAHALNLLAGAALRYRERLR